MGPASCEVLCPHPSYALYYSIVNPSSSSSNKLRWLMSLQWTTEWRQLRRSITVSCHVSSMSTSNIELSLADRDAENNTASPPPAASAADDNDLACPSRPSPPSSSCKLLADVSPSCPLHWNLGSSAGNPAHSCHSQIFDDDYIRNTVHENLKKYAAKHQSIEYHES